MEELDAFSDEAFDASSFVNDVLSRKPEEESLEAHLASLAMKLHIISREYTDQLETGMADAMSAMPRVLNDITRIEDILKSVNQEMTELAGQVRAFDSRNVQGVGDLSRLDTLKTNMEVCKSTLEEHARWNQLVREAKAFLDGGGRLTDSADRIATMHASLAILEHTPGHAERKATCSQLGDALLAAVRPRLVGDITRASIDIVAIKEYQHVFSKLDRSNELLDEYLLSRPARLLATWQEYSPMNTNHATFLDFLTSFLGELLALAKEEFVHVSELFAKGSSSSAPADDQGSADEGAALKRTMLLVFTMLGTAVRGTLQQSLAERLREAMSPSDALASYKMLNKFAVDISASVFSRSVGPAGSGTYIGSSGRDRSDSTGSSKDVLPPFTADKAVKGALLVLLELLYSPFLDSKDVVLYAEGVVLRSYFGDVVSEVQFSVQGSLSDSNAQAQKSQFEDATGLGLSEEDLLSGPETIGNSPNEASLSCASFARQLVEATGKLYNPCAEYLLRCSDILGGLHLPLSISTIASALVQVLNQIDAKTTELRIRCGLSLSPESSAAGVGNKVDISAAEAWVRKMQEAGTMPSSRALVPASLKALQAVGSAARVVEKVKAAVQSAVQKSLQQYWSSGQGIGDAVDVVASEIMSSIAARAAGGADDIVPDVGTSLVRCKHDANPLESRKVLASMETLLKSDPLDAAVAAAINLRATAAGSFLEVCTCVPQRVLQSLHEDYAWVDSSSEYEKRSAAFDAQMVEEENGAKDADASREINRTRKNYLHIDENLLPQSAITQCGEHLLGLVQELEMFAASDALTDLLSLRGGILAVAASSRGVGWGQNCAIPLECGMSAEQLQRLYRRNNTFSLVKSSEMELFGTMISSIDDEGEYSNSAYEENSLAPSPNVEDMPKDEAITVFVNECLQAVCDGVLGLVLSQVVQIKQMTLKGRAQLAVNFDYMNNVITAMGLSVHPLALHVRALLEEHPASLQARLEQQTPRGVTGVALHKLQMCIARACSATTDEHKNIV